MAFNETEAQRQGEANENLAIKLRLEKPLQAQLRRIFNGIAADFSAFYNTTGQIIDANAFNDEISGQLKQAYEAADIAVSGRLTGFARENPDDSFSEGLLLLALLHRRSIAEQLAILDDLSRVAVREFINQSVARSTVQIATTTNNNLATAVQQVQQDAFEVGRQLNNFQVSRDATDNFKKRIPGRTSMIAATEVQHAVEGIQSIEAGIIIDGARDIVLLGQGSVQAFKQWLTREDARVRRTPPDEFDHNAANGQQRRVEEPFIVSGQELQYPGDTRLGASAGNVIYCRCHAATVIDIDLNQVQ